MSNTLDSKKLSDIIKSATQETIKLTESFAKSAAENPVGTDTVSVMVNGEKITLSIDDYNLLKSQNNEIRMKMKADIKSLTNPFKEDLKNNTETKASEQKPDESI